MLAWKCSDKAAFPGSSGGSWHALSTWRFNRAFDFNGFCGIGVLPHLFWLQSLRQAGDNPSLARLAQQESIGG